MCYVLFRSFLNCLDIIDKNKGLRVLKKQLWKAKWNISKLNDANGQVTTNNWDISWKTYWKNELNMKIKIYFSIVLKYVSLSFISLKTGCTINSENVICIYEMSSLKWKLCKGCFAKSGNLDIWNYSLSLKYQ